MTPIEASPPVTGAWREGDAPGRRQFADVGDVVLESGLVIPSVRLAYETWGSYDGTNAVLVLHALTGDSHVCGPSGPGHPSPGWWNELVGPGRAIDTDRFFVVAPNILGGCQGSTGPSSSAPDGRPWGSRFPYLTVRDQVQAERQLAEVLGIDVWHTAVGGSAGGMRALEWAVIHPERVERLFLLATTPWASAEQIALSGTQIAAIRADASFHGGDYYDEKIGPSAGLDIARRIAHISYRSEPELAERFGRLTQDGEDVAHGGRFAVESYLEHHGAKLIARFDANSYIVLSAAMNSHDVGRGRGGARSAMSHVRARTVVAGIDSDRLYPLSQQQALADDIPGCDALDIITSPCGHDGFLVEFDQVGALASALLDS